MTEWSFLAPAGAAFAGALILLFGGAAAKNRPRTWQAPVACLSGAVGAFLAAAAALRTGTAGGPALWFLDYSRSGAAAGSPLLFGGSFVADGFGLVAGVLCLAFAAAAALLAARRSEAGKERSALSAAEYFALFPLTGAALFLLACAHDFLTLVVCLELASISLYIMTSADRNNPRSSEAGLKYLILGGLGTALLLMGVAFVYGATGSVSLTAVRGPEGSATAVMGLGLILAGLLFKLGAVPFQFWVPDVYEGAPTATTALMASAVKVAALAVPLRICFETFGAPEWRVFWTDPLRAAAALTMIFGNLLALKQESVKRMLAYSAIAHTGYLLTAFPLGAGADGAVCAAGARNALFYAGVYGAASLGAFGVVALKRADGRPLETFADFSGLARGRPLVALCMATFMLSLGGLPPLGGFMGKFFLFQGAAQQGEIGLVVIAVLTTVLSLYYYLRVVTAMYMPKQEPTAKEAATGVVSGVWPSGLVLCGAGALLLLAGILPGLFLFS